MNSRSESIGNIATALAAAQSELRPAIKDAINPHLKSKYANLASVWEAAREPLVKNGLSVVQTFWPSEPGTVTVVSTLMHKSGEWIESPLTLPTSQNTAQGYGSAITYARRYGLSALLGVIADEDDDGHGASAPRKTNGTGTQVQPRRNSDPQEYREERVDGQRIHQKQADPATGSTAPIMRGEENEHFQPRTSAEDALNAKGLISHKGWMKARKLDPENKALSLWLLNRAGQGGEDRPRGWTSRKELTADDWTLCNNALAKLTHPQLTEWVQQFYAAIKAEEAGAEEDPFAGDDPALDPSYCFACGSREGCECSNELKIKAYASMKAAEAQTGALLDVEPVASGARGFGSD